MLEQMSNFLYGITIGAMPYNIGIWTIFSLGSILLLDKCCGESKLVTKINNVLIPTDKIRYDQ